MSGPQPDPRRPARRQAWWWRLRGRFDRLIKPDWLIAVAFTIGMALLGSAIGIVPDVAAEGWSATSGRRTWMIVFAAGAVLSLLAGILLWRHRTWVLRRRGTAYIVEAIGAGWQPEDKYAFLTAVSGQFASLLKADRCLRGHDWRKTELYSIAWRGVLGNTPGAPRTLMAQR